MVCQRNNEILSGWFRGRPKQVCITCTWRLLFIANLPNSCFSCSETCLTNSFSSKLAMWTGSRSNSTQQITTFWPPNTLTSTFANDILPVILPYAKQKRMHFCIRRRVSATAFASCSTWPLMGALRAVSLFQKSISTVNSMNVGERTNRNLWSMFNKSKDASEWSPSWCTCIVTQIPVQHTGMTLRRWASEHMTCGGRGGGRTARRLASFPSPASASRWHAGRNPKQYTYTMQTQAEHQHSWSSGLDSLAVCMRFRVRIWDTCTFCQNVLYAHILAYTVTWWHILSYTFIY
jgi:hypothetical protein